MMRRLFAAAALIALLVVPPLLLLRVGFTDAGAIGVWSTSDIRPLLLGLTLLGWVAWLWWAVAVGCELVAVLGGTRLSLRLPGLRTPRVVAAGLLAVVFASTASMAQASPQPTTQARSATALPLFPADPAAPAAAAEQPAPGVRHRVQAGDDLWSLAESYYGEGTQWRSIVVANPMLAQDPLAPLVEGTELAIIDPTTSVTVQRGDTLTGLARTHLGDARRWPEIHALNRDRISDPDQIDIGWVLRLPGAATTPSTAGRPEPDGVTEAPAAAAGPSGAPSTLGSAAQAEPQHQGETPFDQPSTVPQAPIAADQATLPALALVGGITALTAAAIIGGIGAHRHLQAHSRPLGRRFVQPGQELSRYETALVQVAAPAARDEGWGRELLLDRAQRLLGAAWSRPGARAAALVSATVDDHGVAFTFTEAPRDAPAGFVQVGQTLAISWDELAERITPQAPAAFPALVTLGRDNVGASVMLDALESQVLGVACPADPGRRAVLSALLLELSCAPWADELELCAVTGEPDFVEAVATPQIQARAQVSSALDGIEARAAQRSAASDDRPWRERRLDPDLGPAWAPQVTLFECPLTDAEVNRLRTALDGRDLGLAAIVGVEARSGPADWELAWSDSPDPAQEAQLTRHHPAGQVTAAGITAVPQTVSQDARSAVTGLFALAGTPATQAAPWWLEEDNDMDIVSLRPFSGSQPDPAPDPGPRLHLLGPIELTGCAGQPPNRAVRQCVEYCAWLHLHPGASPQQMTRSLLVAEGTRRSNMSRLRTWLGSAPDGTLYLPDAYSGRIWLADDVSSDWGDLLVLTAGGINALSLDRLVTALRLVRGAPLADAAPGQWGWAEEVRADASALIRDLGVVAARRALEQGDTDTARWAAGRALLAAPEDELLMVERIRTEHRAGRTEDVRRLVQRVTRTARTLQVDLLPDTVDVCQEVVEGRLRARG